MSVATFTKLRSGAWGLRVTGGAASPGAFLAVTKRDGTTQQVTVGEVVWQGKDEKTGQPIAICTMAKAAPKKARKWRPCGYPGCNPSHCDECDGEGFEY